MKKKTSLRRWTAAELKQLRALAKARHPASRIAKLLKRSLGAVAQKAIRHRVRFRSRARRP